MEKVIVDITKHVGWDKHVYYSYGTKEHGAIAELDEPNHLTNTSRVWSMKNHGYGFNFKEFDNWFDSVTFVQRYVTYYLTHKTGCKNVVFRRKRGRAVK